MTDLNDSALLERMAEELARKAADPMELALRPITVVQYAAALQLAMRHPGFNGAPRDTAVRFLTAARAYFADAPATLEVLRRGDDPGADQPSSADRVLKHGIGYDLVVHTATGRLVLGIRCHTCGRTSYHPTDVEQRYCGACHKFHEDGPGQVA